MDILPKVEDKKFVRKLLSEIEILKTDSSKTCYLKSNTSSKVVAGLVSGGPLACPGFLFPQNPSDTLTQK
jgi:hypothetical protein